MTNDWNERGFTLIELTIAVAIVGILAAIAYPSYAEHVAKGRRADARVRLAAAQQWMERYYTERYTYASSGSTTDNTDFAKQTSFVTSPPSAEGAPMYTLSVAIAGAGYTLTAQRQPGSAMANDVCGDLTLTQDGSKSVVNYSPSRFASLADAVSTCWR